MLALSRQALSFVDLSHAHLPTFNDNLRIHLVFGIELSEAMPCPLAPDAARPAARPTPVVASFSGRRAECHTVHHHHHLGERRSIVAHSAAAGNSIVYAVSAGEEHNWPLHAEHNGRVTAAVEGLTQYGLTIDDRVMQLSYSPADPSTVKLVHSPDFVDRLEGIIKQYVRCSPS